MHAKLSLSIVVMLLLAGGCFSQCPSITVIGPAGVTESGQEMKFRVHVQSNTRLNYSWSVSAGTIAAGQGTEAITVLTDHSMAGGNLTATVTVGGISSDCKTVAFETAPIAWRFEWESVDEWQKLNDNDQRGRLDAFFTELSNNPHNTGLIIVMIPENERQGIKNRRIQLYWNHMKFRKFDLSRMWFCFEPSEVARTNLYRFPPAWEERVAEFGCKIIKGGDLK